MLISYNWIKKYVNLPDSITPQEVAEKLKLATVEVEKVIDQGKNLENIVVGKIIKCEKHPNADKLKVCVVDVGNEKLNIVCGGSNVAEGMLVAVAKVKAKVKWHGEGELVELKLTSIRGVESFGMICASEEIGLGEMFPKKDEKEILNLSNVILSASEGSPLKRGDSSASPQNDRLVGKLLVEVLGLNDAILEIDNKSLSNRPDLWGHYGIAREVAVLFNRDVENYEVKSLKSKVISNNEVKINLKVEDAKLCPRYMAVAVSGVKVGESPNWLKQKLMAVGQRPINNIVDITNYVMLDLGQPMHAFDAKQLAINNKQLTKVSVVVRRANNSEKFTTLDEVERTLDENMLMITNSEQNLAFAGVMGGLNSGVNNDTTTIVFESANFEPGLIRRTSSQLGIRSESSARFEKSLDPNWCPLALAKAVELTLECCPNAKVASKVADNKDFKLFTGPLEIPVEFFAKILGAQIPTKNIVAILIRLGFEVKEKKNLLLIKIPTWRATKDISIAEDIVEEAARIYGYENIISTLPKQTITPPEFNLLRGLEYKAGKALVKALGYTEVYNYSFVSENQIAKFGDDVSKYLELNNPLSKEKPYLRRYLMLNLLENVKNNIENYSELKIFEIGKKYIKEEAGPRSQDQSDELLPRQDSWLTAVFVNKKNNNPFWQAKRASEIVANELKINWQITEPNDKELKSRPWEHPARAARLMHKNYLLGYIYQVNPQVVSAYGLDQNVGVFGLNLSLVAELFNEIKVSKNYLPVSVYPQVTRDVAFLINKKYSHQQILEALTKVDPLISQVELFDVFEGEKLGAEYKSMAYHITYSSNKRTLTSAEVDAGQAKVEKLLTSKFGAEIRK